MRTLGLTAMLGTAVSLMTACASSLADGTVVAGGEAPLSLAAATPGSAANTPRHVPEIVSDLCMPDIFAGADFDAVARAKGATEIANPIVVRGIAPGDYPDIAWSFADAPRLFFFRPSQAVGRTTGCTIGAFDGDRSASLSAFITAMNEGFFKHTGQLAGYDGTKPGEAKLTLADLSRNTVRSIIQTRRGPDVMVIMSLSDYAKPASSPDVGVMFSLMARQQPRAAN